MDRIRCVCGRGLLVHGFNDLNDSHRAYAAGKEDEFLDPPHRGTRTTLKLRRDLYSRTLLHWEGCYRSMLWNVNVVKRKRSLESSRSPESYQHTLVPTLSYNTGIDNWHLLSLPKGCTRHLKEQPNVKVYMMLFLFIKSNAHARANACWVRV